MGDTVFRLSERRAGQPREAERPSLDSGHLHEIHTRPDDGAAALAFALAGEGTDGGRTGNLFLVHAAAGRGGCPYGPGLAPLGVDPARLTLVATPCELGLLRAGLDIARCADAGTVVLDAHGAMPRYDLTASRRLALAAEHARTRVIVLRGDAEPRPSAARTRWRVGSAASVPLEAQAPGLPAIDIELLRWRGGPAGRRWRLEWDENHATFRETRSETDIAADRTAPLPGAVVPLAGLRAGGTGSVQAARRLA